MNTSTGSASGGFVPLRADALELLGAPTGRREGDLLCALSVGAGLAEDANWRTDRIEHYRSVAWARARRIPWRRFRRSLRSLEAAGVGVATLRLFRPGTVVLTPRDRPGSLLHDPAREDERFVAIARGAFRALADEHALSWTAQALLLGLLLLCDWRDGDLPDGWTKARLCEHFGLGWRRLSAGLSALAAAGLIAFQARPGQVMRLSLLARPVLVAPTAPGVVLRRREQRALRRDARRGTGEAAEVAASLLRHHGLDTAPSRTLMRALADALATGEPATRLLERLAACGNLASAVDPMAVLVARVRSVTADLAEARARDERRREAEQRKARESAELADAEASEARRFEAEDRWLAAVLGRVPSGRELGLHALVADRISPTVAHLHARIAELIAHFPDLDPAALAARWAEHPCAPEALDITGIAPRNETLHGPPGSLPQARAGPSLAERLAEQNA